MYDVEPRTETQDTLARSELYLPAVTTVSPCSGKVPLKTSLIHAFHRLSTKEFNCLYIKYLNCLNGEKKRFAQFSGHDQVRPRVLNLREHCCC